MQQLTEKQRLVKSLTERAKNVDALIFILAGQIRKQDAEFQSLCLALDCETQQPEFVETPEQVTNSDLQNLLNDEAGQSDLKNLLNGDVARPKERNGHKANGHRVGFIKADDKSAARFMMPETNPSGWHVVQVKIPPSFHAAFTSNLADDISAALKKDGLGNLKSSRFTPEIVHIFNVPSPSLNDSLALISEKCPSDAKVIYADCDSENWAWAEYNPL